MQLYHFTNLLSLPAILREGITTGEVPISPNLAYSQRPSAANLTTNGDPAAQDVWTGGPTNKIAIRLTVELPVEELTSFREVKEKYRIRSSWLKLIAPYEHRRHWYFAMNGVRPEQIEKVELLDNGQYRQLSPVEVQKLVAWIEAEVAEKLEFSSITSGPVAGARAFRLKGLFTDSWLMDGPAFRAEEFGTAPAYPWQQQDALAA